MRDAHRRTVVHALALAVCLLTGSLGAVGGQWRDEEASTRVRALLAAGRYEEAQSEAERFVSDAAAATGADSEQTSRAKGFLVSALLLNGRASDETIALADRVVQSEEALLGSNSPTLATALRNLGDARFQAGDYSRAIAAYDRAVAIREHAGEDAELELGEDLDHLARALTRSTRYDEAARRLDRSLHLKESRLSASDIRISRTLESLGWLYQRRGEYAQARPVLERALAIRERAAPQHPEMVGALNLLGDQRWFEGALPAARDLYLRAVEIAQRTLRADHPDMALSLRLLATSVDDLGDVAEGKSLRERALAIAERNFGPAHLQLAGYLNDLAISDKRQGDYSAARTLYERALRIKEDRLGRDHLDVATTVHNLAVLHVLLGDFVDARRLHDRAISIWRARLGPAHPYIAIALQALGEALLDQHLTAQARSLFEQAVAIRERTNPDHPEVAEALAYLAKALARLGARDRAERLSARAIAILTQANADDSPSLASVLMLHADIQAEMGQFEAARASYERSLALTKRVTGDSHPDYAQAHAGLAFALAGLGEFTAALDSALHAEETGRRHLRLTVRSLPERQSLGYAANRPKGLDLAISLSTTDRPDSRVFDALVRNRAVVLDEMAARRHVGSDAARADVAPLRAELTSARQRLANLVVRGPSDQRPQQYVTLVDDARREKELAERALAEKSTAFRDELARDEIGLDAVRAALPERTALVAFARYDRTIIGSAPASASNRFTAGVGPVRRRTVPSYVAFVISASQRDIGMVRLGSAASVDALVARWRQEATDIVRASSEDGAEPAYRAAGAELRKRVWDPIAGRVKGADTVFVVPDGTLNTVSFAALPVGQTKYLIDQKPVIHYLSAERDLVLAPPSASNHGLLAVGGAAFDDATLFARGAGRSAVAQTGASPAAGTAAQRLRASCGDLASVRFEPLAATTKEVREVARLWSESPSQVLENHAATERAFKQAAPGHRVLHLATHGFFLGSTCSPAAGGTRSIGGLTTTAKKPAAHIETTGSPLLLSGLALAGANRRASAGPDEDDGILTAEEVTGLNLEGVEWAVLSACDTGLGEVQVGEGVFGLRRAFQVAGVRTMIMSLWSVEDQATLEWMRALYAGRLQKKLSTADAVREASLTVLRARRARGLSTHPFYWAGFVAAGDWR